MMPVTRTQCIIVPLYTLSSCPSAIQYVAYPKTTDTAPSHWNNWAPWVGTVCGAGYQYDSMLIDTTDRELPSPCVFSICGNFLQLRVI